MRIGIIGCSGRMGKELVKAVLADSRLTLVGGTEHTASPALGKDVGIVAGVDSVDLPVTSDNEAVIREADAVIDFTTPANTLAIAELAARHHTIHVSGTTGLSEDHFVKLKEFAALTPIIWSSNMSIGVNLLFKLVEKTAALLDDSYDIEILEMHHRHKKDAPSGTALSLGHYAAKGRHVDFNEVACLSREGFTGERIVGEIGFATLRGGSVIGDHTVMFASDEDRIEITHKSSSRVIYAKGAVRACLWAKNKCPGFYSIADVLEV